MRPQAPASRMQTARALTSRPFPRDSRKIYHPADIPVAFQTGHRRFEAERPSTVDAYRRQQHLDNGFVADTLSYYPRIRENPSARETREQKARSSVSLVTELPLVSQGEAVVQPQHRKRSNVAAVPLRDARKATATRFAPPLRVMNLDQDGMATLHSVFHGSDQLSEEDFVLQVFKRHNAQRLEHSERTRTHLSKTPLPARLLLDFLKQNLDILETSSVLQHLCDFTVQYQADDVPTPVKLPTEIQGMFYFADVNQVLLHDEGQSGFWMLDVGTNKTLRQAPSAISTGHIVDAMFWSSGCYIITSSTSPVISLYDIDYLKLRQQIPCDGTQMALTGHDDPSIRRLYSSSTLGQIHVWNLDSLTRAHSFFSKGHEICTDLIVVDAMDQLAAACLDGKIYMIDLHLCQPAKTLCGHHQGVTMLRYSSENGYIVSGGVDQSIHVWNPHVETKIGSLLGHRRQLIGVEVVPNSPQIVSADESGTVKIWDLRKFSCLQTVSRDTYVKNQDVPRMRSRPMKAMSYFASKRRIAVAHSAIYFLDETPSKSAKESFNRPVAPVASVLKTGALDRVSDGARTSSRTAGLAMEFHENRDNASRVPVAVIVSDAMQCIIAVATRHIATWALTTGALTQCAPSGIEFEITSVAEMDDQRSCFVGTERGTIARLILPGSAVVTHKKVSELEIAALKWVAGVRYLACSLENMSDILILRAENFETMYTLNHWRSAQCVLSQTSAWAAITADSSDSQLSHENDLFVPAQLRSFFKSNEIGWFKKLFVSAAPSTVDRTVDSLRAHEILDRVIPSLSETDRPTSRARPVAAAPDARMTFPAFLEEMKRRIELFQNGGGQTEVRKKLCEISGVDVNASALHIVSGSSADGTFCVWNLRNGTVLSAGQSTVADPGGFHSTDDERNAQDCAPAADIRPRLAQVRCLEPLPYVALVSDSTSSTISIWSSVALPPVFPHPFQRIVDREHGRHSAKASVDIFTRAERADRGIESGDLITTMAWHFDDQGNEMLIAVGDERGIITVYDFEPLHTFVTRMNGHAQLSDSNAAVTLMLSTRFSPTHEWQTDEPTPFRSLTTVASSRKAEGKRQQADAMFVLLSDSGSISIWSAHGQCLGKLIDHLGIDLVPSQNRTTAIPWGLGNRVLVRMDTTQERLCSGAMTRMEATRASTSLCLDNWTKTGVAGARNDDYEAETSATRTPSIVSGKAHMRNVILSQLMHQR